MERVFAQRIGKTALIAFESGAGSLVVSEMLSQENETDWIFDRRIANQHLQMQKGSPLLHNRLPQQKIFQVF